MTSLDPLPMSQKKEDLMRYLSMRHDIYTMMASETDREYKWLMSDKCHLKNNCKRKPPYDWSDILENSKDEAMRRISKSGNEYTSYYWNLAPSTSKCPNWIARWFLYHKFRYRDGRNRNPMKREDGRETYSSSSKHSHRHRKHEDGVEESNEYDEHYDPYAKGSQSVDQAPQGYGYPVAASTNLSRGYGTGYSAQNSPNAAYQHASNTAATYQEGDGHGQVKESGSTGYWDPVRDSAGR